MAGDRSYTRCWPNGGHAWITPGLTYPETWVLHIPTGSDRCRTEAVSSLEEARRLAEDNQLPLEVDDWTYTLMLRDGLAPPDRPEAVLQPTGDYPGAGAGHDNRQLSSDVLQQAPDFIGLTGSEAKSLATQRGIDVRIIREREVITLDYCATRLNLYLDGQRIASASVG